MPNQSTATNVHPLSIPPAAEAPDASDPIPVMRRELALLRVELRAREDEARRREELLFAHIDRIMESRDQWQREAERLSALVGSPGTLINLIKMIGTGLARLLSIGLSWLVRCYQQRCQNAGSW
jgi:hypothetical protein